jgi:hypothetical protein
VGFGEGLGVVDDNVQLHLPSTELHYSQVWAHQMLTPVIDRSFRYISGIKDFLQTQPDGDLTVELKGPMGLISYFTYAAETRPHQEPRTETSWSGKIRGDETFWVLIAETGYVVWCFDKRVVLPSINHFEY